MLHKDFIRQIRPELHSQQKKKDLLNIPNKLVQPREYERKIQFWIQVLTDYSWHRASLSLSEHEISTCFHLEAKNCKKIIKHMITVQLLKPYRDRFIFTENLRRLNRLCHEEWKNDDYLTLFDIERLTLYKFVDRKKHNQQIIQETPDFYFELKYQNNVLKGAKVRDGSSGHKWLSGDNFNYQ